jgi:hypothetical protein
LSVVDFAVKAAARHRAAARFGTGRLLLFVDLVERLMHFVLLILRMVLARLIPAWRDSLTMAARADGRVEHLPHPGAPGWDRWVGRKGQSAFRCCRAALALRGDPVPGSAPASDPSSR